MEPLSFLSSLLGYIKSSFSWILKKLGYKMVKLDDYKEDEVEVDFDYPTKSSKCIEETKSGATFYWSEKYNIGYERYFEVEKNNRRVFKHRRQYLWIKRPQASALGDA